MHIMPSHASDSRRQAPASGDLPGTLRRRNTSVGARLPSGLRTSPRISSPSTRAVRRVWRPTIAGCAATVEVVSIRHSHSSSIELCDPANGNDIDRNNRAASASSGSPTGAGLSLSEDRAHMPVGEQQPPVSPLGQPLPRPLERSLAHRWAPLGLHSRRTPARRPPPWGAPGDTSLSNGASDERRMRPPSTRAHARADPAC